MAKFGKTTSFLNRFREFINRGNVVDMAVGVIIGGAFGKIVTSLVNDVINPPLGLVLGGANLSELKVVLQAATPEVLEGETVIAAAVPEVAICYGAFLQQILDFLIVALCVFLLVNTLTKLKELTKKKEQEAAAQAPAEPPKPTEAELLSEIRDLLREKK